MLEYPKGVDNFVAILPQFHWLGRENQVLERQAKERPLRLTDYEPSFRCS